MTADSPLSKNDLPEELVRALDLAIEKNARGPVILPMADIAGYTDYVLIVSGRSDRHVRGITDGILSGMRDIGRKPIGTDGLGEHAWDLLDFDDFLIHVFYHPVREFYDLESMWNDAPRVKLDLPDEVTNTSELTGLAAPDPMPGWRGDREFGGFADEFADDAPAAPGAVPADSGDDDDDELFEST